MNKVLNPYKLHVMWLVAKVSVWVKRALQNATPYWNQPRRGAHFSWKSSTQKQVSNHVSWSKFLFYFAFKISLLAQLAYSMSSGWQLIPDLSLLSVDVETCEKSFAVVLYKIIEFVVKLTPKQDSIGLSVLMWSHAVRRNTALSVNIHCPTF